MSQGQRCSALGLVVITLMSCAGLFAQGGNSSDLVLNRLKQQFPVTVFSQDASQVLTAGAVVTLQKDGFLVFRYPVPAHPISTYKNGKLSQGFGDTFATCLANGMNQPNGCNDIPQKTLMTGEKFWISAIVVGKKDIQFVAVTDPYDDGRYIGQIKFPFGKGSVPTPDEAVQMVSEVLMPEQGQGQDQGGQPGQVQSDAGQTNSASNDGAPADYAAAVQGKYVRRGKPSDFLVLGRTGGFFVHQDGKDVGGNYRVEGDTLIATSPNVKREWRSKFIGDSLHDPDGMVWEKQANSASAPSMNPAQGDQQAAIPGTYVLQATGSHLLLLPDGSFTKSVAGGQGQGKYAVDGDNLTLTFASTGFAQHFKIQSGNLVDMNTNQRWTRTEDAPRTAPTFSAVPPPPTAPLPDIAPPPPPADAPPPVPPTIALGQTMDQVTAGFGQPLRVAKLGAKTIFYYKDMKVTFTNGKVSDVE